MKWLSAAIVMGFISFKAIAHSDEFWLSLNDELVNIELQYSNNPKVQARYPELVRSILDFTFGWSPGVVRDRVSSCALSEFKFRFLSEARLENRQAIVSDFINGCSVGNSRNQWLNSIKNISQRGYLHNHPFLKYSFLNFPEGLKTRALWGIKVKEKKDLIVIRPGIFASVDELFTERYLISLLNELNDFHIVVLENSTSGDQFVNNSPLIMGAPKEAFENLYLIDHIRKHPVLSLLVNKIHLMGISLGGNGVLLSSLINKRQQYKYFDKTVLLCPVVNLDSTFSEKMENGLSTFLMDLWSRRRLQDLVSKSNFLLTPFFSSAMELSPRWIKGAWDLFEKDYQYRKEWQTYLTQEYYQGVFAKDYQFYKSGDRVPDNFYVLATKTDPIVSPDLNYQVLKSGGHEKSFFYMFDQGLHCSLAYAYQWKFLDQFLPSLFESRLPVKASVQFPMVTDIGYLLAKKVAAEILNAQVISFDSRGVELLVYFELDFVSQQGKVLIPLKYFSLENDYARFDPIAVKEYVSRYIQTKAEIEIENGQFFIRI